MKNLITLKNILPTLSLLIVIVFQKQNILTLLLLILLTAWILFQSKSKTELILFFIAGIFGATAEILAIYSGAWNYTFPSLLGIPIWLPVLWGIAAIFISRLKDSLDRLK